MKFVRLIMLVGALALLSPNTLFARNKDRGSMRLLEPAQVGSTQLAPGNYKVEWHNAGSKLQVQFEQNNKIVATATGRLKQLQHPSHYDDVVLKPARNGNTKTIDEIDFSNRIEALQIVPTS